MHRSLAKYALVAATFALALGQTQADAQVKPFKLTGSGIAPDGLSVIPGVSAPHTSIGQATELGNHTGAGFFTLVEPPSGLTAKFSSAPYYTFTAANGDQLVVTYGSVANGAASPGEVTLTPHDDGSLSAVFVAEFNPVPSLCTGRFAKLIRGSFVLTARSTPFFINPMTGQATPFLYTWDGEGTLEYRKGR